MSLGSNWGPIYFASTESDAFACAGCCPAAVIFLKACHPEMSCAPVEAAASTSAAVLIALELSHANCASATSFWAT